MHLFLQGDIGSGKSTLLQKTLAGLAPGVAGLLTQRLIADGKTAGFRAAVIDRALQPLEIPYSERRDSVFILGGKRDILVLEDALGRAEAAAGNPEIRLILLDEIGGIELISHRFTETLKRILSGGKPCIGVFKSARNLAGTAKNLKLGDEYSRLHRELEEYITDNGELLTFTRQDSADIETAITRYLKKI